MTKKREEDWIQITTPDNIDKIVNSSYILKLLGIAQHGDNIHNLYSRIQILENDIDNLRKPDRQAKILKILRREQNQPHNYAYFDYRIIGLRWSEIWELVESGKLETFKSGTVQMFKLTEEGWKDE